MVAMPGQQSTCYNMCHCAYNIFHSGLTPLCYVCVDEIMRDRSYCIIFTVSLAGYKYFIFTIYRNRNFTETFAHEINWAMCSRPVGSLNNITFLN